MTHTDAQIADRENAGNRWIKRSMMFIGADSRMTLAWSAFNNTSSLNMKPRPRRTVSPPHTGLPAAASKSQTSPPSILLSVQDKV